jgi:hypothetical protein
MAVVAAFLLRNKKARVIRKIETFNVIQDV